MDSLYIIIPAYNEAENVDNVIEEWYKVISDHDGDGRSGLVLIDDGSTDDTLKRAQRHIENKPLLKVISRKNCGHGAEIYHGYRYALDAEADYIFQTDSDGQTLASEFEDFWNDRENYDVIIGNRAGRQDGFARRVVSLTLRILVECIFRVRIEDTNTPYRLMNRRALAEAIGYIPTEYSLTNVGLTAVFASMAAGRMGDEKKIKMSFKRITFRPRTAGVNSINIRKIIKIGTKAVGELIGIRKNIRI